MPGTTAEDLRADAEAFAAGLAAQTGEALDFSPASLATLDALLAQWRDLADAYGGDRPLELDALAAPAAAYLGEVLIGALGGCWVIATDADAPPAAAPHVVVTAPADGRAAPLSLHVDVQRVARQSLAGTAGAAFTGCLDAVRATLAGDAPEP